MNLRHFSLEAVAIGGVGAIVQKNRMVLLTNGGKIRSKEKAKEWHRFFLYQNYNFKSQLDEKKLLRSRPFFDELIELV